MPSLDPTVLRRLPEVRTAVVVLGALTVAQGVVTVAAIAATASLVNAVAVGANPTTAGWALIAALAGRAVVTWLTERRSARSGVTVSAAVRRRLLDRWLTPGTALPGHGDGPSSLATSGVTSVEPWVARYVPALAAAAVVPLGVVVILAFVDWPSALVVVLTLPLLPVFAALVGARTADATAGRRQAMDALAGHFLDVVRGLPTLAAYGRADRQVASIKTVSERHRRTTMDTLRLAFLSSAALDLLATISVALVAVAAGLRLADGSLDLHTALLAILLAPEAYWPIRRVGVEFHASADGGQAFDDVLGELDEGGATPSVLEEPRVRLSSVTVSFPGAPAPVLDRVELDLGIGLTVVTGASGSGKSTLLATIAGVRQPMAGLVRTGRCHLMTQTPLLVHGTLRDNLTLSAPADDLALWTALRTVDLDGIVAALPGGLDGRLGADGFGLSAGQRARLALARAILDDAAVLLLDEPAAHLDAVTTGKVQELIEDLARTRCVVLVTHSPPVRGDDAPPVRGDDRPSVRGSGARISRRFSLESARLTEVAEDGAVRGAGEVPEPGAVLETVEVAP